MRLNSDLVHTDAADFEAAVAACVGADEPLERIAHLEKAVGCYRGPLLPGYYAEAFLSEQKRLVDMLWKALNLLREAYEEAGEREPRWSVHERL